MYLSASTIVNTVYVCRLVGRETANLCGFTQV